MTPSGAVAAAAAFSIVLVSVPIITRISLRRGLTDSPGPLKIHSRPTPRLGGIAILLAIFAAVLASGPAALNSASLFAIALVAVWAMGFADDLARASAAVRLAVEFASAALLWFAGWRIPIAGSSTLSLILTCTIVVFFVNAFNFLDGADGVAAGAAATIAAGYLLSPAGSLSSLGWTTACGLLAACLAFLVYNFPPAEIFLGDSGSTIIGFAIAFLSLDFGRARPNAPFSWAFPLTTAAFPLLDAALAILRRILHHTSPFHGDRVHFYDLLLHRGWSARSTALACYAINGCFVALALLSLQPARFAPIGWLAAFGVAAFCALAVRLGSLSSEPPPAPHHLNPDQDPVDFRPQTITSNRDICD